MIAFDPEFTVHFHRLWLSTLRRIMHYLLDDRPHFDIMGPTYRPDDPEATEEVWVPVRL